MDCADAALVGTGPVIENGTAPTTSPRQGAAHERSSTPSTTHREFELYDRDRPYQLRSLDGHPRYEAVQRDLARRPGAKASAGRMPQANGAPARVRRAGPVRTADARRRHRSAHQGRGGDSRRVVGATSRGRASCSGSPRPGRYAAAASPRIAGAALSAARPGQLRDGACSRRRGLRGASRDEERRTGGAVLLAVAAAGGGPRSGAGRVATQHRRIRPTRRSSDGGMPRALRAGARKTFENASSHRACALEGHAFNGRT